VLLAAACAVVTRRRRAPVRAAEVERVRPSRQDALRWTLIAVVPSALLLGVTRHLATDVASVPLLWVVPLAVYLLTFVLAFSGNRPTLGPRAATAAAVLAVPALLGWAGPVLGASLGTIIVALLTLTAFGAVSLAAHRRLWDARPAAADLTSFYLWVSAGGVIGGIAAALVAPVVFDTVLEFPLALAAGIAVLPAIAEPGAGDGRGVLQLPHVRIGVGVVGAVCLVLGGALAVVGVVGIGWWAGSVFRRSPRAGAAVIAAVVVLVVTIGVPGLIRRDRTFYGVSLVEDIGGAHQLQSGTTVHGVQRTDPDAAREPLAYYTRTGPIGQAIDDLRDARGSLDVGVIGLGAGSIAAYAQPGDRMTFYEIDPAVVSIATDPDSFTYLSDARAPVDVQLGDGRLLLERAGDRRHDLLVLDAFSSDAIPVHLLTREAFGVYRDHLAGGGLLAVHVSSRFFELAPQVGSLARDASFGVLQLEHDAVPDPLGQPSQWVAVTDDARLLDALAARGWSEPDGDPEVWTDDHADLLSTLRLLG
jgi:hypothetical protein